MNSVSEMGDEATTGAPAAIAIFEGFDLQIGAQAVLQGADLRVQPGEVVVIMGPSGVGKSLLTDAVFGLLEPSATVRASSASAVAVREGCVVFQHTGGLPHLSVWQNLRLVAQDDAHAERALSRSGLPASASPERLSGGERRRLAVQRALSTGKSVLWFDEPAAGLDIVRARALARQIHEEARAHAKAVVIVEHQPVFVTEVADRVLLMLGDGQLRELPREAHARVADLSAAFEAAMERAEAPPTASGQKNDVPQRIARTLSRPLRWFRGVAYGFMWPLAFTRRGATLAARSLGAAYALTGLRGLPFFAVVASIFALIFLLVFELAVAFVDPSAVVARMGPQVVVRVTPVLACLLAAAQAGSSLSAWLGTMQAQRQLDALRVLHAPVSRSLVAPAWLGAMLGVVTSALVFGGIMAAVFVGYLRLHSPELVPVFEQQLLALPLDRAFLRVLLFSAVVASVAVDASLAVERRSDSVAKAVTSTIIWGTIWVISSEAALLAIELRP